MAFSSLVTSPVGPGMAGFALLATMVSLILMGELLSPKGECDGIQGLNMTAKRYKCVLLRPDFLEHENLSGLSVLIYVSWTYGILAKIWAKPESGLTTVQLKKEPPVFVATFPALSTIC